MSDLSWGRYPRPISQDQVPLLKENPLAVSELSRPFLPRGLGRSYGDSCLISHGTLLSTLNLDQVIAFDDVSGVIKVQPGLTIGQLVRVGGPRGWFPPVTPGTQFVTVGGAIANDVHGKNYHLRGSFGHSVVELELLRSNGEKLICSRGQNSQMFFATLGGLGLTGIITSATIQLLPVESAEMEQESIHFNGVEGYVELNQASKDWEYSYAWIQITKTADRLKGIFFRARHCQKSASIANWNPLPGRIRVPIDFPGWVLNDFSISAFNRLYRYCNPPTERPQQMHFENFFYPLDSLRDWNRMYGRRGFLQYQILVPFDQNGLKALDEIFALAARAPVTSFLCGLKAFSNYTSEGLMSFPRPGITLGMDFPLSSSAELFQMLNEYDRIVLAAGGSIYPAKDSRMSKESFAKSFPNLEQFRKFKDPDIVSDLWRRLT